MTQPERYRLWTNAPAGETGTVLVRLWPDGTVELATRERPSHTWGPPVVLREMDRGPGNAQPAGSQTSAAGHRAEERAATGRDDDLTREPRLAVSLVPAYERGWTDVEAKRGERVCVMAHVRSEHAVAFANLTLHSLLGDVESSEEDRGLGTDRTEDR